MLPSQFWYQIIIVAVVIWVMEIESKSLHMLKHMLYHWIISSASYYFCFIVVYHNLLIIWYEINKPISVLSNVQSPLSLTVLLWIILHYNHFIDDFSEIQKIASWIPSIRFPSPSRILTLVSSPLSARQEVVFLTSFRSKNLPFVDDYFYMKLIRAWHSPGHSNCSGNETLCSLGKGIWKAHTRDFWERSFIALL